MSIEQMTKAREAAMNTSAYKNLLKFFDENSFSEIDGFAKSGKNCRSCCRFWYGRRHAGLCFRSEQRRMRRCNEQGSRC